jgi:hypothetical protein
MLIQFEIHSKQAHYYEQQGFKTKTPSGHHAEITYAHLYDVIAQACGMCTLMQVHDMKRYIHCLVENCDLVRGHMCANGKP